METSNTSPKRSLILAGGGLKVAFQAGVLQVWLDEAGIEFDHADGSSGGVFNLAMYCQGMTGTEIAGNWRGLPILKGLSLNWPQYFKLFFASSLLTYKRFQKNVLRKHWGLDWQKIRSTCHDATFNLYNFSKHHLEVREPRQMDEAALVSAVSLPGWFPPVRLAGDDYIDAVYATDANVLEAVARGADEIWVIWTVSEQPLWRNGPIYNYFQVIEVAANGQLRADLARIEANNSAIEAGHPGEFGRNIDIKVLRAEVPLHYLLNFRSARFTNAVDLGVEQAREWCRKNNIPCSTSQESSRKPIYLEFTETMRGSVTVGELDSVQGARNAQRCDLSVRLTISTDDLERFLLDPSHKADAQGWIECDSFGGRQNLVFGEFNLFANSDRADTKKMRYCLHFEDASGAPHTLLGEKRIRNDAGFDAWTDTTVLYTRIFAGHIEWASAAGEVSLAAGVIRVHLLSFARQMMTFKVRGGTLLSRLLAVPRFLTFFTKSVWRIFGRRPSY